MVKTNKKDTTDQVQTTSAQVEAQKPTNDLLEEARQAFLQGDAVVNNAEVQPSEIPAKREEEEIEQEEEGLSNIEKEAMKEGWVPKKDFRGDKSKWRPAEDWSIKKSNNILRQRLETMETTQREILSMLRQEREMRNEQTIAALKLEKRKAIEDRNVEAVEQIDEKISKLRSNVTPTSQMSSENIHPTMPPEAIEFEAENRDWFNFDTPENASMRTFAVMKDKELGTAYPTMPLRQRFAIVKNLVDKEFNRNVQNVDTVEIRKGRTTPRNTIPTYDDLQDDKLRKLVDDYVTNIEFKVKNNKLGVKPITKNGYVAQLFKAGAIDKNGNVIY